MTRPGFYRPLKKKIFTSELAANADTEVLQAEQRSRVARDRLGTERPVRREGVAADQAVLAHVGAVHRVGDEVAAARDRHAEARARAQGVGPLHALVRREADRVAPVVLREAEAVALRAQPPAGEARVDPRAGADRQPPAGLPARRGD